MISKKNKVIFSIIVIFFLRMFSTFMLLPVLSTHGSILYKSSNFLIGIAIGIYSFSQALFQVPLGILSDQIGRRVIILFGLLVTSFGSLVCFFSDSIWFLILGRFIQGIGAISSTLMALVSDETKSSERIKIMFFIGVSIAVSFLLSMTVSPVFCFYFKIKWLFLIITMISMLCFFLAFFCIPKFSLKSNQRQIKKYIFVESVKNLFDSAEVNFIYLSTFLLHFLLILNFMFIPKLLMQLHFSSNNHWKLYFSTIFLSFLLIGFFIRFIKNNVKFFFVFSIFMFLVSEIIFFSSKNSLVGIFFGMQFYFFSFNILGTLISFLISRIFPVYLVGTSMGVNSTIQFFGIFTGSIFSGYIDDILVKKEEIFFYLSVVVGIWLLIALKKCFYNRKTF